MRVYDFHYFSSRSRSVQRISSPPADCRRSSNRATRAATAVVACGLLVLFFGDIGFRFRLRFRDQFDLEPGDDEAEAGS